MPLAAIGCIILAACALTGCVTSATTGKTTFNPVAWFEQPTTQAQIQADAVTLEPIAASLLADYVSGGGKITSAQAVPLAFQAGAKIVPTIVSGAGGQAAAAFLGNAATQYAADPKASALGSDLATAALASLPANPTPAQVTNATVAAGVALSAATNAPAVQTNP